MTRQPESSIIIFGRRAVTEALHENTVDIQRLIASRQLPKPIRKQLAADARARQTPLELIDQRDVSTFSAQPRHDQGIAARVKLNNITNTDALLQHATGNNAANPITILALDNVTNPQNVGMIIRSAVAAGINNILWPTVGVPWINGLVVKAAAATIYKARIIRETGPLEHAIWNLQASGFKAIALDANAKRTLQQHRPPHRAIYILGAEATGITPNVKHAIDDTVRIDMKNDVESLNVAVAAALLCFAVANNNTNNP